MENLGYSYHDDAVPIQQGRITYNKVVEIDQPEISKTYLFVKRAADIVLSACALLVLAIPMLVISLVIFLNDGHSPIFKQTRVGKDGKTFTMYKFRTMRVDAEQMLDQLQEQNEADGPVFKIKEDPRITKVGKFLRRTSLDELPQFWNVLNGTMSLVGPRPPLPNEVAQYTPYQRHRLDVKGGITCTWQCSGRSNISFDQWVEMDLQYIRERSVWTDFKILCKTVGAVLKRDGAE